MKVDEIYKRVSITLQDLKQERWKWDYDKDDPNLSLQPLLNQAIEAVIQYRPDSVAVTETVQLESGAKQTIPEKSYQLLEVIRNMGSDGDTPGKTVHQVDRRVLDSFNSTWTSNSGTEINCYAYDLFYNRKIFWVSPPVKKDIDVHVEITHAELPDLVESSSDTFPLPDIFADPVYHHILFQILTGDNEASNFERGMNHWQIFNQKLGIKTQADTASTRGKIASPKEDE